jgi:hypothetical protein
MTFLEVALSVKNDELEHLFRNSPFLIFSQSQPKP